MRVFHLLIVWVSKTVLRISRVFRIGAGGTWPGEIALRIDPNIFQYFASRFSGGIIFVAGTNGKTTTSLMIKKVLESDNNSVVHNDSGANLLNGLVSACIKHTSWNGSFQADYGVFEVDENSFPIVLYSMDYSSNVVRSKQKGSSRLHSNNNQFVIVLLNLFRDQLDRYGEVDVIAEKWEKALRVQHLQNGHDGKASKKNTIVIIANADDPLIAHLGNVVSSRSRVVYFGLKNHTLFQKNMDHATDSIFCLNCGGRLAYEGVYYSHIGIWHCTKCKEKRPTPDISDWKSPLPGLYNQYNTLAAVSVAKALQISDKDIEASLATVKPAFGRQEECMVSGKKIKIFLSKNPAGFNQSLQTVFELGATHVLFVLNDRIPDGRDVSWIWDVDFEIIPEDVQILVSGDRAYDMALRLQYAEKIQNSNSIVEAVVKNAIHKGLGRVERGGTLYILPTYSAMLEVRKILRGRKIL